MGTIARLIVAIATIAATGTTATMAQGQPVAAPLAQRGAVGGLLVSNGRALHLRFERVAR